MTDFNLEKRVKQARGGSYNYLRALYEFVDNYRKDVTKIQVKIVVSNNKMKKILISDNSKVSFDGKNIIDCFNWTTDGQSDDELSNFGVGFKSAAVNLGDKLELYTIQDKKYYKIEADWLSMCRNNTQIPQMNEINYNSYKQYHPYEYGSTFIISELFLNMFEDNVSDTFQTIILDIKQTYNFLLNNNFSIKIISDDYKNKDNYKEKILNKKY